MITVILLVAVAAFSLLVNRLTGNKDHPGRVLIWLAVLWLINVAFLTPMWLIFRPQTWVLYVAAAALALAIPDPKWVKRKSPAPGVPRTGADQPPTRPGG